MTDIAMPSLTPLPAMPSAGQPAEGWRLMATAFALNVVWELSHGPLYAKHVPVAIYLRAAAADAVLIAASSVAADRSSSSRRTATATFVWLLTAVAIAIEVQALTSRRWSYTDAMPTVGGIGLSPLVQLAAPGSPAGGSAVIGRCETTRIAGKSPLVVKQIVGGADAGGTLRPGRGRPGFDGRRRAVGSQPGDVAKFALASGAPVA